LLSVLLSVDRIRLNMKLTLALAAAAASAGTVSALDNGRATRPPMGW
jgi:hypothetical protein